MKIVVEAREGAVAAGGRTWIRDAALAVVAGVLVALVAVPVARRAHDASRVDAVVELIGAVERAVWSHYRDTDLLAIEDSRAGIDVAARRRLTCAAEYSGWRGPYLEAPLSSRSNPFGGPVLVEDSLAGACGGFRLRGEIVGGAGQLLAIGSVPRDCARAVDERLDSPGEGDWRRDGRVQWRADTKTLLVFILDV